MFFDGVPSSRYTVEDELPATVRMIVILLPSTAIVCAGPRPPIVFDLAGSGFHVPTKSGLF